MSECVGCRGLQLVGWETRADGSKLERERADKPSGHSLGEPVAQSSKVSAGGRDGHRGERGVQYSRPQKSSWTGLCSELAVSPQRESSLAR